MAKIQIQKVTFHLKEFLIDYATEDTVKLGEAVIDKELDTIPKEKVREIVEGEPLNLIEAVAERIAAAVLSDFPLVEKVEITLHKPEAPIKGLFKDAAVTVERSRA